METESEELNMKLLLEHGRVLSGNTFVQDCPILIEDDTILAVGEVGELPTSPPKG